MTKINVKGTYLGKVAFVSNLWEYRLFEDEAMEDYVGPKTEETAMMHKIESLYDWKEVEISIQKATKRDIEMYEAEVEEAF